MSLATSLSVATQLPSGGHALWSDFDSKDSPTATQLSSEGHAPSRVFERTHSIGQQIEAIFCSSKPYKMLDKSILEHLHCIMPKVYSRINKRSGLPITGILRGHPPYSIDLGVIQQRFLTVVVRCLAHRQMHCPLPQLDHDTKLDPVQQSVECRRCKPMFGESITIRSRDPLPVYYIAERVYGLVDRSKIKDLANLSLGRHLLWPDSLRHVYTKFRVQPKKRMKNKPRLGRPSWVSGSKAASNSLDLTHLTINHTETDVKVSADAPLLVASFADG